MAVVESLWLAGSVDSCWARIATELETARARRDSTLILDLLVRRGHARALIGLMREAEPDLRTAVGMAERADDGPLLRTGLHWLGYVLDREGRNPEASAVWNRLLIVSQASGDTNHEAWAWTGLGFVAGQTGDTRESADRYGKALALFRAQHDIHGEAFVLNGLGSVAWTMGDYPLAEKRCLQAAEKARQGGWPWLEAIAWTNIASLRYAVGDPGEAREIYRKAAELHRQTADLVEAAFTRECVARCDVALGLFDEGIAELQRLREEYRTLGIAQLDGELCNALAETRRAQGRWHSAAQLFRESLRSAESSGAEARRNAILGLAGTLAEVDSLDEARRLLEREASWFRGGDVPYRIAFDIARGECLLRADQATEALPAFVAAEREAGRLGERGSRIRALWGAARADRRLGRADSALAHLNRALRVWEAERGLPADPEWREIRGATAADVVASLGTLLLGYPPGVPPADRTRAAFDAVQGFKARTLMERMLGPAGEATPALAVSAVRCADLQRSVLRPGELLLDFCLGSEASLVFAVSKDDCRAYRLPGRQELESVLVPYLRMTSSPPSNGTESGGTESAWGDVRRRLRELLLGPVLDLVERSPRLIVIPDGVLHRVSFAALLVDDGVASPGTRPALQVAPSATILAQLRQPRAREAAAGHPARALLALAGGENGEGRRLTEARREVHDLATRFQGVETALPVAPETSSTALPASLARYDVLHLAGHARIDEERPWRSSIHLNGGGSDARSRVLTASAIARTRLPARLAVLSTCSSAGGRVLSGEGVQGPAAAFLVAGVPAVVASLWPVDDASTRRLMRRFYGALARGETVAEALATCQAELRRAPRSSHPFHWAGFVVVGDGDLRVPLTRTTPLERHAVPVILLALGILAVFSRPLLRYVGRYRSVISAR
jgi:tetratricopeptide (TPR) repeat protein